MSDLTPKGFSNGQYVDRFRLRDKLYTEDAITMKGVAIINNFPAADVVEVRHGRWIYTGIRGRFPACKCSACGNVENADWALLGDNVNYCPNCGAKMDGGQDE